MKNARSTFKLINGVEIPVIGFGTWQTPDGDVAVSAQINHGESDHRQSAGVWF